MHDLSLYMQLCTINLNYPNAIYKAGANLYWFELT